MANLDEIKEALLNAQALYALYLGATTDHKELSNAHTNVVSEAKAVYEASVEASEQSVKTAEAHVEEARKSLEAYQEHAYEELGIGISLLSPPAGAKRSSL